MKFRCSCHGGGSPGSELAKLEKQAKKAGLRTTDEAQPVYIDVVYFLSFVGVVR